MKKMVFVKNLMNIVIIAKRPARIHIFATKKLILKFRNQNLPDLFKFFSSYQSVLIYKKVNNFGIKELLLVLAKA